MDERHLKLMPGEDYSIETPDGRAKRAALLRELDAMELMKRLAVRTTKFYHLHESGAPAIILERQRELCREVFEELMHRGPGRSRMRVVENG